MDDRRPEVKKEEEADGQGPDRKGVDAVIRAVPSTWRLGRLVRRVVASD